MSSIICFLAKITPDAVFIVLATLFTGWLQGSIGAYYQKKAERDRLNMIRDSFLAFLESNIEAAEKQATYFSQLSEHISAGAKGTLTYQMVTALLIDLDNVFMISDLHYSLATSLKRAEGYNQLRRLTNFFPYCKMQITNGRNSFEKFHAPFEANGRELVNCANSIFRLYDKIRTYNTIKEIPLEADVLLQNFDKILGLSKDKIIDSDSDPDILLNELVNPLYAAFKGFSGDPRPLEIHPILLKMRSLHGEIKSSLSVFSKLFLDYSNDMQTEVEKLKSALAYFHLHH